MITHKNIFVLICLVFFGLFKAWVLPWQLPPCCWNLYKAIPCRADCLAWRAEQIFAIFEAAPLHSVNGEERLCPNPAVLAQDGDLVIGAIFYYTLGGIVSLTHFREFQHSVCVFCLLCRPSLSLLLCFVVRVQLYCFNSLSPLSAATGWNLWWLWGLNAQHT